MTILQALAILEAATLECKKRQVNTPELRAVLDFLEPHIQPAWLTLIRYYFEAAQAMSPTTVGNGTLP